MLIFKVDFEKAFDSVSWKYLDFVLISLGFGSKWRTWIRACLNSSRASVLINGSPTSKFSIKRGLRQGDPLSPFLFILVMEGLHCSISNAVNSGLIRGVKFGSSDIILSYLFYTYDVVITTEWNARDLDNIIRVLHVFYLASGLKINIHKSNIYGIGVSNEEVSIMATSTGCAPGSLPFTYLGLPIGSNMNLISNWQPLIDRFQSRLSSWKANMLSIGGRLTLIKAVLGMALEDASCPNALFGCANIIKSLYMVIKEEWVLMFKHSFLLIPPFFAWVVSAIVMTLWEDSYKDVLCHYRPVIENGVVEMELSLRDKYRFSWSIEKDDIFTVGETCRIIDSMFLPSLVPPTSWYKVLPRKVKIFLWRLYLDRLSHRLNLSSRGMDIQSISCPMCNGNVEFSSHIFFECDMAFEVWRMVQNWCDITLPSFPSHDQMRSWLCSWQVSKEKNHRVTVIFASLCWWLWRELEVGELEVGELVRVLFGDLVGELLGELVGELLEN
ncbi:putative RNA-directed DNA polymerase, eukaryota, reverse transcriptase zinc-binding domain protein [Tanacetum coccineum]|uniref:RNA-directed DNA polymerase, eukaryota, reverse transcriptase zinc-binding domain protein n=1 Tax=Tanacetum coccineum TaxID=301880 RepID=A0ABQ5BQY2_9ASTR